MKWKTFLFDLLMINLGTCLYAFGLVYFNMANQLAEGGVTGVTLILLNLFGLDPALTTLLINIPLILIGGRILGRRSFLYTIIGTIALSLYLFIWQRVPFEISVDHDLLIAALLAGFIGGLGSGLVYRVGGTTGGADIVARIMERKFGFSMGKSLLGFDICVLLLSLTYIDLKHMMYTLIVSYVFSLIIDFVQDGSYKARGLLIISNKNTEIGQKVMEQLERGVTFLKGEGGFSKEEKKVLYIIVSPAELVNVKRMIEEIDSNAFISVINVHEAIGEGFTYKKPPRFLLNRK